MIPAITLFPGLHRLRNRPLRRTLMVLTLPLVVVETYVNATIHLINGFRHYWNAVAPTENAQ